MVQPNTEVISSDWLTVGVTAGVGLADGRLLRRRREVFCAGSGGEIKRGDGLGEGASAGWLVLFMPKITSNAA